MRLNKIRKFIIIILTLLILSLQGCCWDCSAPDKREICEYTVSYIDSSNCIHFHCNFYGHDKGIGYYHFVAEIKIASDGAITVIKKENKRRLYPVNALCVNSVEYVEYDYFSDNKHQNISIIESNDGSGWKEWKIVDDRYDFSSLFVLKNTDSSFETLTKEVAYKYLISDDYDDITIEKIAHPIANDMLYNNYALVGVRITESGASDYYYAKYIDNAWTFTQTEDFGYMKYNSDTDSFTFEEFTEAYKMIFSSIVPYASAYNNLYYDYDNDNDSGVHYVLDYIIKDDGTVHHVAFDWDTLAFYYEAYDPISETPEVPVRRELIDKVEGYNF